MNLTPRERDKLMVALAATVARARLARGVKLNYPESIALISDFVLEGARGEKSVAELMSAGGKVLTRDQVMDGIPEMIAAFTTDIPALTNWGEPVLLGPGSIHVAHTDGEFISKRELNDAVELYVSVAGKLLSS